MLWEMTDSFFPEEMDFTHSRIIFGGNIMRSRTGSSFATFLLALVLAAVPLMAIFGVPKLTSIAEGNYLNKFAGEKPLNPHISLENPQSDSAAPGWGQGTQVQSNDPNQNNNPNPGSRNNPFGNSTDTSSAISSNLNQSNSPFPSGNHANSNSQPVVQFASNSVNDQQFSRTIPSQNNIQPVSGTNQNSQAVTWRGAIEHLNQLGINNYRLEPGVTSDQFLFVCFYTPQDNPRITIRFEAESSDPLRAVEKVLTQIANTLPET